MLPNKFRGEVIDSNYMGGAYSGNMMHFDEQSFIRSLLVSDKLH